MNEEFEQALAVRWPCGCVTYADAKPSEMRASDKKLLGQYVAEGAEIIRGTPGEIRALPNFLVHCEHRS